MLTIIFKNVSVINWSLKTNTIFFFKFRTVCSLYFCAYCKRFVDWRGEEVANQLHFTHVNIQILSEINLINVHSFSLVVNLYKRLFSTHLQIPHFNTSYWMDVWKFRGTIRWLVRTDVAINLEPGCYSELHTWQNVSIAFTLNQKLGLVCKIGMIIHWLIFLELSIGYYWYI